MSKVTTRAPYNVNDMWITNSYCIVYDNENRYSRSRAYVFNRF